MREGMKAAMALAAAAALLLGGCDESSKNTVHVRPAAAVPVPAQTANEGLPFPEHSNFNAYNLIDRRSRVDIRTAPTSRVGNGSASRSRAR